MEKKQIIQAGAVGTTMLEIVINVTVLSHQTVMNFQS